MFGICRLQDNLKSCARLLTAKYVPKLDLFTRQQTFDQIIQHQRPYQYGGVQSYRLPR